MRTRAPIRFATALCALIALAGGPAGAAAEAMVQPPGAAFEGGGAGLGAYLDAELLAQQRRARDWRRILDGSPKQREATRARLRAELLEVLRPWPGPQTDLAPASRAWFDRDGVEASLVQITTHPGVRLTCALLVPAERPKPAPAILLLHGMLGTLQSVVDDVDYHHGFGLDLAKRGFIVLAPFRFASTAGSRSTLYTKALAAGWSLEAIELWQVVRALDHLLTLDGVDPQRVGVYGISLGGQQALELAAVDARPTLVVASAWFTERFAWLFQRRPGVMSRPPTADMADEILAQEHDGYLPAMRILMDDLNLVALVQPRHLAIVTGTRDPRYPGARREFAKVKRLYERAGAPERVAFVSFEGGHETSVASVAPFLERWGADLAGP